MAVTPLQLATMVARIANGGYAVTPHLAQDKLVNGKLVSHKAGDWPDMGISAQAMASVRRGMTAVCNEQGGTGYATRITDPAMAMAGKSGSAQVKRMTARERELKIKDADIPWKDRDNAFFVAFAPVSAPRYAVAVCIEHGMHGGSAAGPVARDMLLAAQRKQIGVAPPGTPDSDPNADFNAGPEGGA